MIPGQGGTPYEIVRLISLRLMEERERLRRAKLDALQQMIQGGPCVLRRHYTVARALFVFAGVTNTLLSVNSFGVATGFGWFLLPCLLIAAVFLRKREWKISGARASSPAAPRCCWRASAHRCTPAPCGRTRISPP